MTRHELKRVRSMKSTADVQGTLPAEHGAKTASIAEGAVEQEPLARFPLLRM